MIKWIKTLWYKYQLRKYKKALGKMDLDDKPPGSTSCAVGMTSDGGRIPMKMKVD